MILNLTQHPASADQIAVGVVDLAGDELASLKDALTFGELPTEQEIRDRAEHVAELACMNGLGGDDGDDPFPAQAMIGGALWLMAPLAEALRARSIEPLFAFSVRETEEQKQSDGSVRKVAVFRHAGFVPAVA
ncbi:MAG TPA: hypothetical protein VLG93_06965 [Sulfuricaulis sp.]|nr:hypothetical protein [Sulfuricaulis sp.]